MSTEHATHDVPILRTARLVMRGHRLTDLEDSVSMWADPAVTQHIGGRPFSREESWARVCRYVGHWALLGFGYWILHDASTGAYVGEAGFASCHRALDPPLDHLGVVEGTPEIGWALVPSAQGRGLGTEAVTAALAWADGTWPGRRTICMIDTGHARSVQLAHKVGYREIGRTTYLGADTVFYARDPA